VGDKGGGEGTRCNFRHSSCGRDDVKYVINFELVL
jgi:hypothetical protein